MALSQDEQRILAEIEQRLAGDDPGLASSLTAFRRPGPAKMLRSPRVRIVGSLFTVLLVAMVSLTVYAMIPFRAHLDRQTPPASAGASANTGNTAISAVTSRPPAITQRSSASSTTNVAASAGTLAPTTSTAPNSSSQSAATTTAGLKSQQAKVTAAEHDLFPIVSAKP